MLRHSSHHRRALLVAVVTLVAAALVACASDGSGPAAPQPTPVVPNRTAPATPPADTGRALYVSVDGDDAGPGTREAPLRTINRAAALVEPGTTVRVGPGRYEGNVTTSVSGTADERIRFVSEPGGAAEVVGSGGDGPAWRNRGDHVDIVGFTITGDNLDGLTTGGSFGRLLGNRVSGFARGNCISTVNADYSLHDIDVKGNVVHGCGDTGTDHGIYVSHTAGTVANNISYGNAGFGIHCWHNCNRLVITNNLVFGNAEGGILIGQGDSPNYGAVAADGFLVANNIVVDNGEAGITESGATGRNNLYVNNNVWGNGDIGLDLRSGQEIGTITLDPYFIDFRLDGTGDYRLQPFSPNIDAGTPEGAPRADIDGVPRPQGGGIDVGVYER